MDGLDLASRQSKRLEKEVLGQYYNHSQFASFARQLNVSFSALCLNKAATYPFTALS